MKADVKERWIEALTSGKYRQGRFRLRRDDSQSGKAYCCLGVLCDLLDPSGWDDAGLRDYHRGNAAVPAKSVLDEAGNGFDAGAIDILVSMNDNREPFAAIAQWIRDNL